MSESKETAGGSGDRPMPDQTTPDWFVQTRGLKNDPAEAMRWLELMTCGGSEFHNDPENCFNRIMRERYERLQTIKLQQRRIRELERQLYRPNILEGCDGRLPPREAADKGV